VTGPASDGRTLEGHGGTLAVAALAGLGVREVFTLSGGHIFPLLDAAARAGFRILDVRHEQTAAFAAEGLAKATRRLGVAVVTAGPGVTNAVSALAGARVAGSPLLVLAGRAPAARWGAGSLQELDHVPVVAPLAKHAATVSALADIPRAVVEAATTATAPPRGPAFLDVPLDVLFATGRAEQPAAHPVAAVEPDPDDIATAARLLAGASRPAVVAGSDVYWGNAEAALVEFAEALRVPVFTNGLGRGTVPPSHELAFSRARPLLHEADVVVVVGTPLDFRLGFGRFGDATVVHVVDHPDRRARHAPVAVSPAGDLSLALAGIARAGAGHRADHEGWIERLRAEETTRREAERAVLESDAEPIHPARVYGELRKRLDRDAIVIGDGGDFVSYAGRLLDTSTPGCFLDPGPFGCLGTGLGYAIGARVAHPDRQVVCCLGDGAFGFSGMDVDSLVRHRLAAVLVVGNNGIWGLEKHPMRALYGDDVAADLQPECRYDDVVRALGGAGETVRHPGDLGPALERALASGVPYLLNVLTDPHVAYPRTSSLA
jgi:acetolactate synthase-1/2/3 large subunit